MKHEIEGEIYCRVMGYDCYEIPEIYLITQNDKRENAIYKDKPDQFGLFKCCREMEDHNQLVDLGTDLTGWLINNLELDECEEENNWKNRTITFQPKTKKVRITVEEIE